MSRLIHSFQSFGNFTDRLVEVLFILGIAALLTLAAVWIIDGIFRRLSGAFENLKPERSAQRAQTLTTILRSTIKAVILFIAALTTLGKIGIDLNPILASAGILGLAVGFGAQSLIKDLLSGFFIVLEDQYGVGDVVMIGDKGGVVEAMNLRITKLRNLDGDLITIPNGTIGVVSNQSKGWARAVVDVGIAPHENVDRAMEIMLEAAKELHAEWPDRILETPTLLGVDEIHANRISLRLMAKTLPLEQWAVGRELRRRIKNAFDRDGIELPTGFLTTP